MKDYMNEVTGKEVLEIIRSIAEDYAVLFQADKIDYSHFLVFENILVKIESECRRKVLEKRENG